MRVTVLGVCSISGPGGTVAGARLGGRRAQVLLTALALGAVETSSGLLDLVWDGAPPATGQVALRGLVRGLRQAAQVAGMGSGDLIETVPGGYRLGPRIDVDLAAAEAALVTARNQTDSGRQRAAVDTLRPVTTVRGSTLLPGLDAHWLRSHRARVDRLALDALLLTADAASAGGDRSLALAAARRLVELAPLDERSHRTLISALHLAGDRAGAVQAFERCRVVLADELGVDPAVETVQAYLKALGEQTQVRTAHPPRLATSFRGRAVEMDALAALLGAPGLVTLTGPGGVGKSRLAAEVSHSRGAERPGAVWWVPLEAVAEDALVSATVALTLGLAVGDDPVDGLVDDLAPRGRGLLVLDAAETVLDGVVALVHELVSRCPLLTVLVTSRLPFRFDGGRHQELRPWALPPDGEQNDGHPLVALLVDRVTEHQGHLTPAQTAGPLVRSLLDRCAGLPLAVELIAAQLAVTSPGDLADQLDELLALADDPVRAVASASYALLSAEEATVFRRFAVLEGEVPLAMVRDVVSDGLVPRIRVLRILGQLAAYGLLRADRSTDRWRWTQDDELHRYARDLLVEHDEAGSTYARVSEVVRALLPDDPRTPPGGYADAVTDMLASVRSFLGAGSAGRADPVDALELAFRLHRYWAATNVGEGQFWLTRLLGAVEALAIDTRWSAYATYALGYLEYWAGDSDVAAPRLRAAADRLVGVDDEYVARALIFLAGLLDDADRGAEAVTTIREAVAIAEQFGPALQMPAVMGIGSVLSERGDPEAAEHAVRAIGLLRAAPAAEQLTVGLPAAAMICWMVGDLELARQYVAEAMPLHEQQARISRVVLYSTAAGLALGDGDPEAAAELADRADQDGTDLGVDRELPLARAILARARLELHDLPGAADRAAAALDAALSMAYDFPLAIGLETAADVLVADGRATPDELAELLTAAGEVRRRGDRPAPFALRRERNTSALDHSALDRAGTDAPDIDPRATARLALKLLTVV